MRKKKIVIASVLKPLNDARMYEKFGISIAETEKFEVHIIGYPSNIPDHPTIIFHPLPLFKRISIKRYFMPWNIYKKWYKVKPDIIIVNTHELLLVSILNKILFGTEILYDIRENYFRNIWYQNNYPPLIKHILALVVRIKEIACAPFIDHKLLAEEKYRDELPFVRKNATIILNKYNPFRKITEPQSLKKENLWRFLYSGTIAEVYGIFEAISFSKVLQNQSNCTLTIIGHCPNIQLFKLLTSLYKNDSSVKLFISETPVDHEEIEALYKETDFALTPYPLNPSTQNCIPAKFYEYIAHKIPIILADDNPYWISFLSKYQGFYAVNFNDFSPVEVINNLSSRSFYPSHEIPDVYWIDEKLKLLNILA